MRFASPLWLVALAGCAMSPGPEDPCPQAPGARTMCVLTPEQVQEQCVWGWKARMEGGSVFAHLQNGTWPGWDVRVERANRTAPGHENDPDQARAMRFEPVGSNYTLSFGANPAMADFTVSKGQGSPPVRPEEARLHEWRHLAHRELDLPEPTPVAFQELRAGC